DSDPTVSSKTAEVCNNGKDDNCNGTVDEMPCSSPANDVCTNALAVTASGTYFLTTVAAKKDYSNTCSVTTPAASRDVVLAITVPGSLGDPAQDVEVWATSETTGDDVAVALETTCGASGTEIECEHIAGAGNARAIAAARPAGSVVYAIVTAQKESAIDVKVDIRAATPRPTNVGCGAPTAVALETPFTVSIIDPDPAAGVATSCAAKTGEYTYSFTLPGPDPADVRIFASTLVGTGTPVVSLRDATCTGELRCRVGSIPPAFARDLAPGTYDFTISGTTQLDASVLVKTYPATTAPANQSCTTAPATSINDSFFVDLSQNEDAIANDCFPGGPAAAYDLELTQPSDVLVVARFPTTEVGAVSLNEITVAAPDCTTANRLACSAGVTPQRVSKRNLPAGSYRVVVADQQGQTAQLSVLVRPTVAPTNLGSSSDGCVGTASIPALGGFFTGDTTGAMADFDAGCDAPGEPIGGARDQMLRLDLAQTQRVVLDMSGSTYATLLDVRSGATCPGGEVMNACYVGVGPNRSFLDIPLGPGTFWVQVDGFAGDRGAWDLDVRILPP
ncbi:MAG TPA: putative metal-binding motif-containing protein, partial [Labilithrix sp.]